VLLSLASDDADTFSPAAPRVHRWSQVLVPTAWAAGLIAVLSA
jgi:hypothetical protein